MPVEIRELVIQAKLKESATPNAGKPGAAPHFEKPSLDNQLERIARGNKELDRRKLKEEVLKDLKIWIKEYIQQERRRF